MKQTLTKLICNLLPQGCRYETLEGRQHVVVPMVILTEGVHVGSMGPLLYSKNELSKTPAVWNYKPIVVYHPSMNGQSVSACDPTILNSRKVGVMLNTRYEDGKLKSEAWIEKNLANKVDDRIMEFISNKEMMELSTGVFIDVDEESGSWNEEEYVGIARNFRPDHLALLPDQVGACSIKDGAGFLRNQRSKDIRKVDNEMSHSNLASALCTALRERYPITSDKQAYVCDVYNNFFIYDYDGKLWRLGFMLDGDKVKLSDEIPVEVVRTTEYRTVEGTFVGNRKPFINQQNIMKKNELVDAIITANKGWAETDRETLMAFNEAQLKLIHLAAVPPKKEDEDEEEKNKKKIDNTEGTPASGGTSTSTSTSESVMPTMNVTTVQDYINAAPTGMREVLINSLSIYNEEKSRLVEVILANKKNTFTKEDLSARPLNELRSIARLAANEPTELEHNRLAPHYGGMAPVSTNVSGEEALEIPILNFSRNGK